jgi:excinuclease ABC subunit C
MTVSALDGIPGLGEVRQKKLVKALGGVNAVKRAELDDLKALSFLPDAVAEAVYGKFRDGTANTTT